MRVHHLAERRPNRPPGDSACARRAARALWLLLLFSAAHGAFGAERSGSTFTPGTLGDYNIAVVSTNPGLYLRNDMFYYEGTDARTVRNGEINIDLAQSTWVDSVKLTLVPGLMVLGARYAAGVNLGLVSAHVDSDVLQADPSGKAQPVHTSGSRTTISDVFVTPVVLSWQLGQAYVAWSEMVSIPSGTYDNDEFVNISRNYWALDSQLALTWIHPQSGLELSGKGGFIVNSRNEDTDYRTGNELHVEGLVAKRLDKRFSLGAVWYYYDQVSADTGSGTLLGNFEGEAFGAGPALRYIIPFESRNLTLIAKWIHEFYTRDRFAGDYIYFCIATRL